MKHKEKIALFIDADNAPAKEINTVLSELARYGVVNIRKAYGNWKNTNLKAWENILHDYAIQPIQQFDLVKGKNATDMAMVIDVMDVLYTRETDYICLVSSDCDFTPLVTRILANGKEVIGFGERKTPLPFVNSCSRFLYFDKKKQKDAPPEQKKYDTNLNKDTKLISLLRQAINANEEQGGWAKLGSIGTHISNHSSFDQRNHGFSKLSDLIQNINLFEIKKTQGTVLWVRDKKKSQK